MKKIALILLITVYAVFTLGIGISEFYCCGKLKSISISYVKDAKEKCNKGDDKSGCCKTKHHFFKVKDNHIAAGDISNPAKHFTGLHTFTPSVEVIVFANQQSFVANSSHAPPLQNGAPIYILNCVYRI